jgi:hypothetical protein
MTVASDKKFKTCAVSYHSIHLLYKMQKILIGLCKAIILPLFYVGLKDGLLL